MYTYFGAVNNICLSSFKMTEAEIDKHWPWSDF